MLSKINSYFKKNPSYNSVTHLLIGIGIGILATYPLIGPHPVRWGLGFIIVGTILHFWPASFKK